MECRSGCGHVRCWHVCERHLHNDEHKERECKRDDEESVESDEKKARRMGHTGKLKRLEWWVQRYGRVREAASESDRWRERPDLWWWLDQRSQLEVHNAEAFLAAS